MQRLLANQKRRLVFSVSRLLRKHNEVSKMTNIERILNECNNNVTETVRQLRLRKLTVSIPKAAAAGHLRRKSQAQGLAAFRKTTKTTPIAPRGRVKRGRDPDSSDVTSSSGTRAVAKKTRDNSNLAQAEVQQLVKALKPLVKKTIVLAIKSDRPASWADQAATAILKSHKHEQGLTDVKAKMIKYLLRIGQCLDQIPSTRTKVLNAIVAVEMLVELHSADNELDYQLSALENSLNVLQMDKTINHSGSNQCSTDEFVDGFTKFSASLGTLLSFFGVVERKLRKRKSNGKRIAEKYRMQLKQKLMAQVCAVLHGLRVVGVSVFCLFFLPWAHCLCHISHCLELYLP